MTRVEIEGLTKRFGDLTAAHHLSLRIDPGEFVAVVGPTGSGKTTLLRLIAGLLTPDEGTIRFDDMVMNDIPPSKRRVRMVFQDYALYPHMKVFKERGDSNLGFPLRLRGVRGAPLRGAVENLASRLGIVHRLFSRKPRELSAGEKQRVAFGRALALPPTVLLLDEPFSNLDATSRTRARRELIAQREREPITTLYVTHNLNEAFLLADRVAVMDEGRMVQVGAPDEIRRHPATATVRELIGASGAA